MKEDIVVEIQNLTKKYGDVTVVDGITYDIKKQEVLGLIGPNGAGKTSTMLMLSTYLQPDEGTITYYDSDGKAYSDKEVKKMIGYVPQEIALYEEFNAVENLKFFGKLYGIPAKKLQNRVEVTLKMVGLYDRRKQKVKQYSGGMKRRLNIAAALLHNPKLVIMDEPTVGIDPQSREKIFDIVRNLKENGSSVIYITHYMEEAENLSDRLVIMDHGKILASDTLENLLLQEKDFQTINLKVENWTEDIQEDIRKKYKLMDMKNMNGKVTFTIKQANEQIIHLMEDIQTMDANVVGFDIQEMNLEYVFMKLTGKELRD